MKEAPVSAPETKAPMFSLQYIEDNDPMAIAELRAGGGFGTHVDSHGQQGEKLDDGGDSV